MIFDWAHAPIFTNIAFVFFVSAGRELVVAEYEAIVVFVEAKRDEGGNKGEQVPAVFVPAVRSAFARPATE